jgi:hypothetical protein
MNNSRYSCNFCKREHRLKFNHDRHVQTCEFLSKSKREQNNEIDSFEKIPTQKEMFQLIQELSIRISKLEKENSELKNSVRIKIKRNFNDILNQTVKPEFNFNHWKDMILNTIENFLETVYNNDLLHATNELFLHFINNYGDKLPIRAYDIKSNIFYIYDSDNTWTPLSNIEFDKFLAVVSHRFLVDFNRCWCQVHCDKIAKVESYKLMYLDYYKKILGGDRISDENRYKRVRQFIYNKIKINIKSTCDEDS